jgi:polyisoprenyl-phosphate glycosyltransferase
MKKLLSVVIPLYNEEKNITLMYEGILKAINGLKNYNYEIIFVDDGSKDLTWNEVTNINYKDTNVKGIRLSRNFGHATALQAGLESAQGDGAIMMDGDLQHPPKLIPELVKEWENGNMVVNTLRTNTKKLGFFKKITSKAFYKILGYFSYVKINNGESDFRLVDKEVLSKINSLPETPKFYRGIIHWIGYESVYVKYTAEERKYGKSSYTLQKMVELARIGFTSFSVKPLKAIIAIGFLIFAVSLSGLLYTLFYKFFIYYGGFSNSFVLVMLIMVVTGLMICFQGIIAIYLVDIFNISMNRPAYIVKSTLGLKNNG